MKSFYDNIVPLVAPVDTAGTAIASPWVDLKTAHEIDFLIMFGVVTSTSADETGTVTVEAATAAASGSESQIDFQYRISAAVGSNTWGDLTDVSATAGYVLTTTDDNKAMLITVDPAEVQTALADARFVRVVVTPNAAGTVTLVGEAAIINPRYKATTMVSAT